MFLSDVDAIGFIYYFGVSQKLSNVTKVLMVLVNVSFNRTLFGYMIHKTARKRGCYIPYIRHKLFNVYRDTTSN